MPNDYEGWKEHFRKQIQTDEGAKKLKVNLRLGRINSPSSKVQAAEEVFMEYEERQAREAAERQRRRKAETLRVARRTNHLALFAAVGALMSGLTAIVALVVSLG